MATAISETLIANQALARIGAKRLNDIDADTTVEAIQVQTQYEQARDSLLRTHVWRFALARAVLSEDTDEPAFEWDHQYILPTDCLRVIGLYDTTATFRVEGRMLLTNDDSANLKYVRKVTNPIEFDSLFVDLLSLDLALRMVMPLSQDKQLRQILTEERKVLATRAMLVNREETNTLGREDYQTWNDARYGGGIPETTP